jgi:hypothetical protein
MNDSLSQLRAKVDAARSAHERAKKHWCDKKNVAASKKAVWDAERYERAMIVSRGGPRPAPNFVPPKTQAEIAADAALSTLTTAEARMIEAHNAVNVAESKLLSAENAILSRWRDNLAREIRALQLTGIDDNELAAKLAELRLMCPPYMEVRINQRFALSALVREVLDEQPDILHIDTPVSELRGEAHIGYERRRAQILADAESTTPLEAA